MLRTRLCMSIAIAYLVKLEDNDMKAFCIALAVVIIAIVIAFIYEIKHTYRDGDLWKK